MAVPLLADLTGPMPISVHEGERTGWKGIPWTAACAFQPAAAHARAAEANGRSSAAIWQLAAGDPAAAVSVELVIDKVPEYDWPAPTFRVLRDEGATVMAIAAVYGKPRKFVADALVRRHGAAAAGSAAETERRTRAAGTQPHEVHADRGNGRPAPR